jgi:hypothetical protein
MSKVTRLLGVLGARLIGKEQAEAEANTIATQAHIFGPRVRRGPKAEDGIADPDVQAMIGKLSEMAGMSPDQLVDALHDELAEASAKPEPAEPRDTSAAAIEEARKEQGPPLPGEIDYAGDENGNGYLSVPEVSDLLANQPDLFDRLLEIELNVRPNANLAPRKGVLRLMLRHEESQDKPRADVVGRISSTLVALG